MHWDWPVVAVKVPGEQAVGEVDPVAHEEPAGQVVQSLASSRLAVLEYVPARQGNCADAPSGQKLPAVHARQAVAPLASWYSPPTQLVHAA